MVYVGSDAEWNNPEWKDWSHIKDTASVIDELNAGVATIALSNVPNFRLWKEKLLSKALDERNAGNVGELKQATFEMDPDTKRVTEILTPAEERGYRYQLFPDEDPLKMNILIELDIQNFKLRRSCFFRKCFGFYFNVFGQCVNGRKME